MAHLVKCINCGRQFDRDKVPFIQITARRYAHKTCPDGITQDPKLIQEVTEKDAFFQMVKSIYGSDYNYIMINSQAEGYIKQYGYTWDGMRACLHWFYNLNHKSLEEGNGGIGIIPFIYDEVRKYYTELNKTQEENKKVKLRQQVIEFNIQSPRSYQRPPRLLDLEEEK